MRRLSARLPLKFIGKNHKITVIFPAIHAKQVIFTEFFQLVLDIREPHPYLKAYLLRIQPVIIARKQDILHKPAAAYVPITIYVPPETEAKLPGIIALFTVISLHTHTVLYCFSCFKQQILHHSLTDGKDVRNPGTGLVLQIIENHGSPVLLRQQRKLPAQPHNVRVLTQYRLKGVSRTGILAKAVFGETLRKADLSAQLPSPAPLPATDHINP